MQPNPYTVPFQRHTLPFTPAKEHLQREEVVREALSWVGTPYRQQADKKGIAVDCSMLVVRCLVDTGILEPFDPRPYCADWWLHKSEERYMAWMDQIAVEIPEDEAKPGDIILFKFGRCFSHSGIISRPGYVVHAFAKLQLCIETELKFGIFHNRPTKFYSIWKRDQ